MLMNLTVRYCLCHRRHPSR